MADVQNHIGTSVSGPAQLHGAFRVEQRRSGFCYEGAASLGKLDKALLIADEKTESKLLFKIHDLLAQGRLCDVQPVRCASDVQFFSNYDNGIQMTYFNIWKQRLGPIG